DLARSLEVLGDGRLRRALLHGRRAERGGDEDARDEQHNAEEQRGSELHGNVTLFGEDGPPGAPSTTSARAKTRGSGAGRPSALAITGENARSAASARTSAALGAVSEKASCRCSPAAIRLSI